MTPASPAQEPEQAESWFRQLAEAAPNGMLVVDQRGRLLWLNAQVERMFGYTRAELVGQNAEVLVPDRFRAEHPAHRSSFFAQPVARPMGAGRELFGRRKDGTELPVEIGLTPISTAQGPQVLCSIVDITARKAAEAALAESERIRGLVLESVGEGLHGLDGQGRIVFENAAALSMFGWKAEEMIGRHAHTLVHHHHADGSAYPVDECPIYKTLADGVAREARDEVFFRQDGTSFPVEFTCCAMRNSAGAVSGVVVTFRDITDRKRAEDQFRLLTQRLSLATRSHGIGVWDWDLANNVVVWDEQMFQLYGLTPTPGGVVAYATWANAVLPQDLPAQESTLQDTVRRRGRSEREFRIRRASDGAVRHLHAAETVLLDGDGNAGRVIGVNIDISAFKSTEQALRASNADLGLARERA